MSFPGAKLEARQRIAPPGDGRTPGIAQGTQTAAGWIPHLRFRGLDCPVKLVTLRTTRGNQLMQQWGGRPIPQRRTGGRLVFALPGGYTVDSDRKA